MGSSLSDARGQVAALRAALLSPSPEEIACCLPLLVEAVHALGSVRQELSRGGGDSESDAEIHSELRAELVALQNDLRRVSGLIEHGASLQHGWAALLGAAVAGYTPSGEAASVTSSGVISVRG